MHEYRRFAVVCEGCSFEDEVERSERAERKAEEHHEKTGHTVVALELPARARERGAASK